MKGMKKYKIGALALLLAAAAPAYAQYIQPTGFYQDAIRYSGPQMQGSLRMQALGGSGTALGGDPSMGLINPAGLGFNRRNEVSGALGITSATDKASGMGIGGSDSRTSFQMPYLGVVFSKARSGPQAWKGGSWSFSMNRYNDFTSSADYTDTGNGSSIVDYFLASAQGFPVGFMEEEKKYGITTIGAMGYLTNLVKPFNNSNENADYFTPVRSAPDLRRTAYTTKGGQTEFNVAYGGNFADLLYLGASFQIHSLNYSKEQQYEEYRNGSNDVRSIGLYENIESSGTGFSGSLGALLRPVDWLRFGVTYHLPTYMSITDRYSGTLRVDYNNFVFNDKKFQDQYLQDDPAYNPNAEDKDIVYNGVVRADHEDLYTDYRLRTPARWNFGLAGFIGKHGFITADLELVDYSRAKLSRGREESPAANYYDGIVDFTGDNIILGAEYRNVVNLKVGAEGRIGDFRLRAGYALYPDPRQEAIRDATVDMKTQYITGGVGYRKNNYYVDFTIVSRSNKSLHSAYVLDPLPTGELVHPIAEIKQQKLSAMLGVGFFF